MRPGAQGCLAGIVCLVALSLCACSSSETESPEAKASTPAARPSGTVVLSDEQQQRAAIATVDVQASEQPQEVSAFGRVLDPIPILDALGEVRAAETTFDAASREHERLRLMRANDLNASARDLEAAAAALATARAQSAAARNKLRALGGDILLRRGGPSELAAALARGDAVLIRVDVPESERLASSPKNARLVTEGPRKSVPARFLGEAPPDPQTPARGYLLLLMPNSLDLRPNTGLTVALGVGSTVEHGWLVPRASIVRTEGRAWIYMRRDPSTFVRTAVDIANASDEGVFVHSSSDISGAIVNAGAQTLLSEEQKASLRVED